LAPDFCGEKQVGTLRANGPGTSLRLQPDFRYIGSNGGFSYATSHSVRTLLLSRRRAWL